MSSKRRCLYGGSCAGVRFPMPDDPGVYYARKDRYVPCSRLVCLDCGAEVRHWDGVRFAEGADGREAALYELATPEHELLITGEIAAQTRAYLCRCGKFATAGVYDLGRGDEPLNWECAGHPEPGPQPHDGRRGIEG
ncbi:MAG: hypothetical protein HYY17_13600 [Planctomycetes bacterium]|nr:hypothetical protein [Planctomycetota bacterium]